MAEDTKVDASARDQSSKNAIARAGACVLVAIDTVARADCGYPQPVPDAGQRRSLCGCKQPNNTQDSKYELLRLDCK